MGTENSRPEFWFAQAEAQFAVKNITTDATKYHYVISAIDQQTAKRIMDLIKAPPAVGKYDTLKARLLDTFTPDEYQRASRLLHMSQLGDTTPSVLMDNMLSLMGDHEPCFLFRQLFLEQMPDTIRAHLIRSKIVNCRELATAADELWESRDFSTSHVSLRGRPTRPGKPAFVKRAGTADSSSTGYAPDPELCFYHHKFGDKARQCRPPCKFHNQGNATSGRQ